MLSKMKSQNLSSIKGIINSFKSKSKYLTKIYKDDTYYELFRLSKNNTTILMDRLYKEHPLKYICPAEIIDPLALNLQVCVKKNAINWVHGYILFSYINEYIDANPNEFYTYLETGTARGFSATLANKIFNSRFQNFKVISIDLLGHQDIRYWNALGDQSGKRSRKQLLERFDLQFINHIEFKKGKSKKIIKNLKDSRVNIAFLDSTHNFKTVLDEFNLIKKLQISGDIIILDDVVAEKYPEVVQAVKKIISAQEYSVKLIDLNPQRGFAIATKI